MKPQHPIALMLAAGLALLGLGAPLAAQTPAPPPKLAQGARPLSDVPLLPLPAFDAPAAMAAAEGAQHPDEPPRFAEATSVSVTPADAGLWETLPGGERLWRLRISAPGAASLNLGFARYHMPAGGRLSVYDPAYTTIRGPFTERDNEAHGQLWTPPLDGGQLVIEALLPAGVSPELLDLRLASVNRGFLDPSKPADKSTGGCNVDVVCAEANPWRDQVRSVAAVYIGGVAYCSGALINNTARDDRPFFLTASHCDIDAVNAPSVVTYWNYENSTCRPLSQVTVAPGDGRKDQFLTGAIFRAAYAPSDFTLLELDDEIPAEYGVFYAGWDRRDIAPASAVAIHHPSVEEKRISFENGQTSVTTYLADTSPGNGTHLRIADWDTGTTEGGSSGSPLFSPDGLVVGQLHGGYAACSNNSPDWYGRLYASWTGGGTASTSLASWLDPTSGGAQTLAGKNPTVFTNQLLLPVISLEH